jgi:hypothetical protein
MTAPAEQIEDIKAVLTLVAENVVFSGRERSERLSKPERRAKP